MYQFLTAPLLFPIVKRVDLSDHTVCSVALLIGKGESPANAGHVAFRVMISMSQRELEVWNHFNKLTLLLPRLFLLILDQLSRESHSSSQCFLHLFSISISLFI